MKTPIRRLRLPSSFSHDSSDTHNTGTSRSSKGTHSSKGSNAITADITELRSKSSLLSENNKENGNNGNGTLSIASVASNISTFSTGTNSTCKSPTQLRSENQRLSSELTFLRNELTAIVSKHAIDKHTSSKSERELQHQIQRLMEDLDDAQRRIEGKDGTMRVLEKQIRSKNDFINELRGRIEVLLRERNEQQQQQQQQQQLQQIETTSTISGATSFCHTFASPPPVPTVKVPTPNKMNRNEHRHDTTTTTPKKKITTTTSANPNPFRSPSPSSFTTPRSKQKHYLPDPPPSTGRSNRSHSGLRGTDPSEGGIETQLTPSTRSTFLLMEQKKTIESLTRALIEKTEQCDRVEKEFEQFKTVVMQETKRAMILSPSDIDMMKGPTSAEEVLCDSDEFDLERSCDDDGSDAEGRDDDDVHAQASANNACNVSGSSHIDEAFIQRLDTLGLDLSMDIADLSALIDDADYVQDAAEYQQRESEI